MRLWHQDLIEKLPRAQLLGQHRECCALRGNGWGRKHSTVDYVFGYSPTRLSTYHKFVMAEMRRRGYSPDEEWVSDHYRGKKCLPHSSGSLSYEWQNTWRGMYSDIIYPEHNGGYLKECLENLRKKGIELKIGDYEH